MKLARSADIRKIDAYAASDLGISVRELMRRSGHAVAEAVRARIPRGGRVGIFVGAGNNGGDGYAAACELLSDYAVTLCDVFGKEPKGEEARAFRTEYLAAGGEVLPFDRAASVADADCLVDAVFGTGFQGELPEAAHTLARLFRRTVATKIAVDVPLGVDPDDGSVTPDAVSVSATVCLSFIKAGLLSYPARGYVGELICDTLGLPADTLAERFPMPFEKIDAAFVRSRLPKRKENSSKGDFGKLLLLTGSDTYRGAAALSLEAALRGGVGYTTYCGTDALIHDLAEKFPEAIYKKFSPAADLSEEEIRALVALSEKQSATLVGCGSEDTAGLYRLLVALLASEGGTLVLDADALNALSHDRDATRELFAHAKRKVILTPHPMEFSRLSGKNVEEVQLHRMSKAMSYAAATHTTLVLKGAGTVVTDGEVCYLNDTGSSALAKAGSGDVLAGCLAALAAQGIPTTDAAAIAVFCHGLAADTLAREFSAFGVTPSDLPKQIAREIARIESQDM